MEEGHIVMGKANSSYSYSNHIILHIYICTLVRTLNHAENTISNYSFSLLSNRFGVTCPHVEEDGH